MTDAPGTPDAPAAGEPSGLVPWALASDVPPRPMRSDSKRNRDAVVDALLKLHHEGNLHPSSAEVAERAGISPRSLFRYFADIDDLARAAVSRLLERVRPLLVVDVAADAPIGERIDAIVAGRLRVYDAIGPSGMVVRLRAPFQPLIAAQLTQARAFFRQQIDLLFAPELGAMDAGRRTSVLAAADVLLSFESFHLLRVDQHLDDDQASASLVFALAQLFA